MGDQPFSRSFRPEQTWFDVNRHLNVVGYLHYFVETMTAYFDVLGFDHDSIHQDGGTMFALQQHLSYLAEIRDDAPFTCTPRLLECDGKRLHFIVSMTRADGTLAATMEQIAIYVDFDSRRPTQMPADKRARIDAEIERQAHLPTPHTVGRTIAIPKKADP